MGKKQKKINYKIILEYSLPAVITIAIMLVVMAIKGIYPFGRYAIAIIDFNDQVVPFYSFFWDVLHGKANLFVNFNLGAGAPMYASSVINTFFSPITLLIGLFERSNIVYALSYLTLLRLVLMATTAYYCFKKFFPRIKPPILLLFSLLWVFSGWTLVHISTFGWLDIMILLPILLVCAKNLVEQGKSLWFIIVLSYMLILSYYMTYMVLIATIVISTVYIFTLAEKQKRKQIASSLFFAISISLLISFITFIPSAITALQAHRFAGVGAGDKTGLYNQFFSKLSVIIMITLPVVFFVKLLTTIKKDKKNVLFFLLSFVICGIGLIVEPINKMWHTGSYYSYPFRYGFVLILIMIFASLYYIDKYLTNREDDNFQISKTNIYKQDVVDDNKNLDYEQDLQVSNNTKKKIKPSPTLYLVIISIILYCPFMFFLMISGINVSPFKELNFVFFFPYLMIFLLSYLILEYFLRIKSKKFNLGGIKGGKFIFIFCLIQIVAFSVQFFGSPFTVNFGVERVTNAYNIDTTAFESNYKIKDRDKLYDFNFAGLINYGSLQTWVHISSEEQYKAYSSLGYNTQSAILQSSGGTILTDILLGNKYVLSKNQLDENYYIKIDEFDFADESTMEKQIVNCYQLNFTMKNALVTNTDLSKFEYEKNDLVAVQNNLYKSIYGKNDDIMQVLDLNLVKNGEDYEVTIPYYSGNIIYLQLKMGSLVATRGEENINLMTGFNDFGTSNGEMVVKFLKEKNKNISDEVWNNLSDKILLSKFDASTFKTVHENSINSDEVKLEIDGSSIKLNVKNNSNSKYVFVPYINLKNMSTTVNNKAVETKNAICNFMIVDLESGENEIMINYTPQYLKICAIISIFAVVLLIVFCVLNKFFKFFSKKIVIYVGIIGACITLLVVGVVVYVKPFFTTFAILFS